MKAAWSENTQNSGNEGRVPAERSGSSRGRKTLATTTGSFVVERLGADHGPGGGRAEEATERPRRDPGEGRGVGRAGPVGDGGAAPAGTLASRVHVQAAAGPAGSRALW